MFIWCILYLNVAILAYLKPYESLKLVFKSSMRLTRMNPKFGQKIYNVWKQQVFNSHNNAFQVHEHSSRVAMTPLLYNKHTFPNPFARKSAFT